MTNIEMAELVKKTSIYDVAAKTIDPKLTMSDGEKEVAEQLDDWAHKIGETGHDPEHQIASFITRTVRNEYYDAPVELLDSIFERGTVGEFDDYEAVIEPVKNTLVAYESAPGGNVPKHYLDYGYLKPTWCHLQAETGLSFADLRRNGWKSVALLTDYILRTLDNKMFSKVFGAVDAAIALGSDNYIAESTALPTQATMDALALYLNDRDGGTIIALNKYIQAASKLNGFVSDDMINEVHRTGGLGMYDGIPMHGISAAKKQGDGTLLLPDKRIFGVAGKIGTLDMKGDVRTYETEETNKEVIDLKVTGFTFGYSFSKDSLENICKVVMAK